MKYLDTLSIENFKEYCLNSEPTFLLWRGGKYHANEIN